MLTVDEKRLIAAVREMFIALGTTPPDDYMASLGKMMRGSGFQIRVEELVTQVQNQYIELGKQLQETLAKAAASGKANIPSES